MELKPGDMCAECLSLGLDHRLRYFYINLEEQLLKCESKTCLWPHNDEVSDEEEEQQPQQMPTNDDDDQFILQLLEELGGTEGNSTETVQEPQSPASQSHPSLEHLLKTPPKSSCSKNQPFKTPPSKACIASRPKPSPPPTAKPLHLPETPKSPTHQGPAFLEALKHHQKPQVQRSKRTFKSISGDGVRLRYTQSVMQLIKNRENTAKANGHLTEETKQ